MIAGDPPEMPQKDKPLSKEEVAAIRTLDRARCRLAGRAGAQGPAFRRPALVGLRAARSPQSSRGYHGRPGHARRSTAFILADARTEGLKPSPEADRRTLIRRLSFDLIGLPPTPEEIEAFVDDPDPNAYEALVDRLLASPHYGERWGRHWLDVVHYGDTHGYDKDKRRDHAWPYRDYVIAAFNADLPFGRFIREQVAGDVL